MARPAVDRFLSRQGWMDRLADSIQRIVGAAFKILGPLGRPLKDLLHGTNGSKRLDYFCVADTSLAVVAELKRPGDLIGLDELRQLTGYVDYLRTRERESNDPDHSRREIKGCLVYGRLRPEAEEEKRRLRDDGIFVVTWDKLLEDAERLHREYLEIVKSRAPEDDPRIQGLGVEDPPAETA